MNKNLLVVVLPAVLLSACVTASKYKAKEAEAATLSQQLDAAAKNVRSLEAQLGASTQTVAGLQLDLKGTQDKLAAAEKSNKDLQESLDANKTTLSKKVSALIKERDDLQGKLDAADAQSAQLSKQLDDAQAARRQLEAAKAAELAAAKKSYDDMQAGLKDQIAAGQIQISQLKGKLTLNMVDQILFDSGSAEVKKDGEKVLDKVGEALNKIQDKDIRIEGHTDDKPISAALRGKFPTNWELSTARATAVTRYLIDHAHVDPARLVAAGYGEFRPKASNDTPEGRAQNRRIEIILVPRD